jgi:hypothetical protein
LGLQEPRLCGEQAAHRRRLLQPREVNLQLADVPAREAALDLRPNPLGQHDGLFGPGHLGLGVDDLDHPETRGGGDLQPTLRVFGLSGL